MWVLGHLVQSLRVAWESGMGVPVRRTEACSRVGEGKSESECTLPVLIQYTKP